MQENTPQVLKTTPYLELKETVSPHGKPWYYAKRPNTIAGAICILPIIMNKAGAEIVFLETRRPAIYAEGISDFCIELPAGLVGDIDKNETFEMAAKKELLEETGYMADEIKLVLNNVASSTGLTSEVFSVAIAKITNKTVYREMLSSDGGVIYKRHIIPFKDVKKWLKEQSREGKIIAAQVYVGLSQLPS